MPRGSPRIQSRRVDLGLSQQELADDAGLSRRIIQRAEAGVENVGPATLHKIAESLDLDYEEVVHPDEVGSVDAFTRWPWSLSRFLQPRVHPADHAFCTSIQEAQLATSSMRRAWAMHLEKSKVLGDTATSVVADESLNQQYDRYEQRYREIWNANPNTMLFSTNGSERSGVSVVLPVTDRAYEALRCGRISFMQIEAGDILPSSQNLIMDSLVEIPCEKTKSWFRITDSLSFALFYQVALLSIDPMESTFRMLGFGASPINLKRLRDMGFAERGVMMPDYEFSVCEFATADSEDVGEDAYKRASTTGHYAGLFKRFHIPGSGNTAKQMLIRRALKLYSPAAKRHAGRLRNGGLRSVA